MNAEIERLSGDWAKAELEGETVFLSEVLANDFIGIGPRGCSIMRPW